MTNAYYANINHVRPQVGSACEVIYDLLEEELISKNTAEALYTGIVHDSGVFKYSSTTEHTMEAAGKLLSHGLDSQSIIDEGFYEKSYIQNQVLGRALLESMLVLNGQCVVSYFTKKEMDFYGVTAKDMGGIVEQLRLTSGVECAIFLYETDNMEYKISLRSKKWLNVNEIAEYFGGGGHKRAAGCTFKGNVHDAMNNILLRIDEQMKAAGKQNV
jgi:phosphoesterase RecJ-like protein